MAHLWDYANAVAMRILRLLLLVSTLGSASYGAAVTYRVRLPLVNLVSNTGEVVPLSLSLRAEVTVMGGNVTVANVGLESVNEYNGAITVAPRAAAQLLRLAREAVVYEASKEILRSQVEDRGDMEKAVIFSNHPIDLAAIPLQFGEKKVKKQFVQALNFFQNETGTIVTIGAELAVARSTRVSLNDMKSVIHSLNPWDHLDWLLDEVLSVEKRGVTTFDLLLIRPMVANEESWKAQMKSTTDRWLVEGRFHLQSEEEAIAQADRATKGCVSAMGCGCLVAGSVGAAGLYASYQFLAWLF